MRFIDFFAGGGGFRHGMEQAGHECVGYCEIDKYARQFYNAYWNTEGEWTANDITTVDHLGLPDADCYCFGFPCQAFSVAGKRGGFEDTRGTLFFEVMRLAKVRKPTYLFAENVAGLLSHDGGQTFGTILRTLGELGYEWQYQVLNSKDFGVPQNRERVFIIGHLRGTRRPEVFPIIGTNSKSLKEIIGGSQGARVYDASGLSCTLSAMGGGMGAKTGLYLFTKQDDEIKFRDIATCLDANYYKGLDCHQARTGVMVNGTAIRKLTPLECFRLQSFPDEHFHKAKATGMSDSRLYKVAGNSVTVNVIREIAKRLIKK
jgi:DNA (cytosine-5)-methyltransferase 1